MKYCPYCGTELQDDMTFCPSCGKKHSKSTEPISEEKRDVSNEPEIASNPAIPPKITLNCGIRGMKWFRFIVNFQLFVVMLLSIGNAIMYADGSVFGEGRDNLFRVFPITKAASIGYAIFLIATAVFAFLTRRSLLRYEKRAPLLLHILYIVNITSPFAFILVMSLATNIPLSGFPPISSQLPSAVAGIFLLGINIVYFNNRKSIFVNPSSSLL